MSITGKKYLRGVMIGLAAGVVSLIIWWSGRLESWEAPTWTWRARYFSQREKIANEVKLIFIDQASLEWAKSENDWGWPWPREVYGAIVSFCERGGAKVLSMDLLFTEPSVYGVSDDEALGEALSSVPVVLSVQPGGSQNEWPQYMPRPDLKIDTAEFPESGSLLFPVKEIVSDSVSVGHVKGLPDYDGVYRRIMPFSRFDNVDIPALGLAAYIKAETRIKSVDVSDEQISLGDKNIPVDKDGNVILRFRGGSDLSEALSAAAVIQSELRLRDGEEPSLSPAIFKNTYVFLGCSAPALLDLRPVPVNAKCPGVVLHSTFVDNLLTDSFIRQTPLLWVIIGIAAISIASALSLTFGGRWWQAGSFSILWLSAPVLAGFVLYAKGYWWPVIAHETGAALGLVGALAANYWAEGRQKAFIKQAFRHYLSGEVIEKILLDPTHLQLGGEKKELTILFTDLAGFSTFSEKLDPTALTALLNNYLTEMTDIIMDEGGTLDKYEGDAIIAFWNAPLEQQDHAMRACRAVLRCQKRLTELREVYHERTGTILRMRAGLNTGQVVVGNMGSQKRFNYTILGDAANLASRLEGANKAFGTETMISESTWKLVSSEFRGRKLADLRVVGRKNAITVYELTEFKTDAAPADCKQFSEGLEYFQKGDFQNAINIFSKLTDDPAAIRYLKRCEHLIENPPVTWDGVWELTEK